MDNVFHVNDHVSVDFVDQSYKHEFSDERTLFSHIEFLGEAHQKL